MQRVFVHAASYNLGLLLPSLTGTRTPRSLQGRAPSALCGPLTPRIGHWERLTCVSGPSMVAGETRIGPAVRHQRPPEVG